MCHYPKSIRPHEAPSLALQNVPESVKTESEVLDHLSDYRKELDTLMTENFHIVAKEAMPVEYREVG